MHHLDSGSIACDRAVRVAFDYLAFTADPSATHQPLIVYLHGSGPKASSLDVLSRAALPSVLRDGLDLPATVICPLAGAGPGWPVEALAAFIEEAIRRHGADPSRVYLTGESMGGRGAFEVAYWGHAMLAALVPLCGFGIPNLAPNLRHLPIWMFHGADDAVLPADRSREMAAALALAGADARLTLLDGAGHDIGREVYRRADLWAWLLAQRRADAGGGR